MNAREIQRLIEVAEHSLSHSNSRNTKYLASVVQKLVEGADPWGIENRKTGAPSTYRNIKETCPRGCAFFDNGCYAVRGFTGGIQNKALSTSESSIKAALSAMVLGRFLGVPARLHTSGDFLCSSGVMIDHDYIDGLVTIGRILRGTFENPVAWSYTHISPERFHQDQLDLMEVGIIVRYSDVKGGTMVLPFHMLPSVKEQVGPYIKCRAQLQEDVTCVDCELCWTNIGHTVVFEAHGRGFNIARSAGLKVLQ